MLAGSDGIGGISFDDPQLAQFIGILALCIILFSGGLDTDWKDVKIIAPQGIALSTAGVIITALAVGLFVHAVSDFSLLEGLLLGAIVSSTDAAAVFSILRTKGKSLTYRLKPTLEFESGSNDPMAYLLTILLIMFFKSDAPTPLFLVIFLLKQFLIGGIAGIVIGKSTAYLVNNIKIDTEGLYPVLLLAVVYFTFSITDILGGNGFLAVYLCALMLGSANIIHKRSILKFFDGLAWLMQITLFLTLGMLVFPSRIQPVIGLGLAIAFFLILVARPLSVFITLGFFKLKLRSLFFISWVGIRGAAPIVFATYPLTAGLEKSDLIFNIVFFISLSSIIIQGALLPKAASMLKVLDNSKPKGKHLKDFELADDENSLIAEYTISQNSTLKGKKLVEAGIPMTLLIALIKRDGKYIIPKGSTHLAAGDVLFVLSEDAKNFADLEKILT
jgi:cell volume regulation protein A